MAKLALTHATRPHERISAIANKEFSHRAETSEGEAARRLLEESGYPAKGGKPRNGQYEFCCPFHEDPGEVIRNKSANFYLDATSSKYYCHSAKCGERGNLQTLERYFGVAPDEQSHFETREKKLARYEANLTPERRRPFYEHGLNDTTIERFRLGFDPDRGCYVIPYLEGRRPVLFRFYDPTCTVGPGGSKYWWEEGSTARLFNASDAVGDDKHRTFLAEGEQKAMLLCQLGYAAVATPGAGMFKDEWYGAFNQAREVYIVFDNDNPEHPDNIRDNCRICAGECDGHNPGQDAAAKLKEAFDFRGKNILLPLPKEFVGKTDINDYFTRDGRTSSDFAELALGEKKAPYIVPSFAEIMANPPEEGTFLVEQGILPQGGRLLIAGRPKVGKAQPLSTPVLAPQGWTTLGDLRPGDEVIGSDGRPTRVTHVHPQGVKPIWRVELSDGSATEVCDEHLWLIQSHHDRVAGRRGKVVSTSEVRRILEEGKDRHTYVPMVGPVEFASTDVPIDSYALGLLLGDGGFRQSTPTFTTDDPELFDALEERVPVEVVRFAPQQARLTNGYSGGGVNPLTRALRDLGLWGHKSESKFIPEVYLRASTESRLALLQGLMDTDGGMTNNSAQFYTSSELLRDGVVELVRSLGGVATITEKGTSHLLSYRVTLRLPVEFGCPFRLGRKVEAWSNGRTKRPPSHRIVSVNYVRDEEAQCITVEADDSLYVTEDYILTHNSIFAENLALSLASGLKFLGRFQVDHPTRVLLLDRELSKRSLYDRIMSLMASRPGYRAAAENLCIDHDHLLKWDQPGAYDKLCELVQQNGAEVIIFDTAYKFLTGDMEKSGRMAAAFDVLDRLIHETGVSIVITHHHRKGASDSKGKDVADSESVAGSFLWTGWPNGTILLNYLERSVVNPFNAACTFTAFRDAAPPEPLAIYRDRESLAYTAITDYSHDDDAGGEPQSTAEARKPTEREVADLLLDLTPCTEDDFMHAACNYFGVRYATVRPYYVMVMNSGYFIKTDGRPPIIKYALGKEEETWEEEHQQLRLVGEANSDPA